MGRYFKIWWKLTAVTSQAVLTSRLGTVIFIIGKVLRFAFFLLFLILLLSQTNAIVGYSIWQVIFFYATFNLLDSLPQFLMREVYRFRSHIVSGSFDYILTKPVNPLFRSLFGGSDILDLSILSLALFFLFFSASQLGVSPLGIAAYIVLITNGLLIAVAFHIFVIALGILTTEVDNTLWLYRDLTQMGRVPVDVYKEPLRGLVTFIIPVGIMMTFPAKALMGLLTAQAFVVSFFIGLLAFFGALTFWQVALRRYASVSS